MFRLAVTGGFHVKVTIRGLALASVLVLAACDSQQENAIENVGENQADVLENQAGMMEEQADVTNNDAAASDMENTADKLENKAEMTRENAEDAARSEEHTSELQSLMRISYAVFCLKKIKSTTQAKVPIK